MNHKNLFLSAVRAVLFASSIIAIAEADDAFTVTGGNCHPGFSGPNCPKQWFFDGGPGYAGQRVPGSDNYFQTEMICSPSCTDVNNPKVCSLIMALHGIYSNPGDQKWLMIGNGEDPEVYNEDEAHGGPFCISFHKSKGFPWEYKCGGDDEAYLVGFIEHALENFPISPDAINLHGFSSGGIQVHHMMNTGCAIESYISAGSSYGSGNVPFPPTSKAAYLIAHGTHDRVVPYDAVWDGTGQQVRSCDCTAPGFTTEGGCIGTGTDPYLHLYGERLAGAIAQLRGWTGEYWGNGEAFGESLPSISSLLPVVASLDLITEDASRCDEVYNDCVVVSAGTLSPFNEHFDCGKLGTDETDVIDFPIPAESDAGPVQVWKINIQNHDYPNKRRGNWLAGTEFFFELRKFFYRNIGRQTYPPANREIEEVLAPSVLCNSPYWIAYGPDYVNRHTNWDIRNAEECRDRCLAERKCVEAFFVDFNEVKGCTIHYDELPCSSTFFASWANAKHYKATTTLLGQPSSAPSESPEPTPAPIVKPPLCDSPDAFIGSNNAGHACLVNGNASEIDSNWGGTPESCSDISGVWTPYDCFTAESHYLGLDSDDPFISEFKSAWAPKCCGTTNSPSPTATPVSGGFCGLTSTLLSDNYAGHSCVEGLDDSNIGATEDICAEKGGQWVSYKCSDAHNFWIAMGGESWADSSDFKEPWAARCCSEEHVPSFCPENKNFLGGFRASYTCADGLGDALLGMEESDCTSAGGSWNPYTCTEADNYWIAVGGENWEHGPLFSPLFESKCCTEKTEYGALSIGNVANRGYTELLDDGNKVIMSSSSSDIWNTADSFRFTYRRLNGNGVVYARVHKPTVTHQWVKSGLMMRESLDANSKNVNLSYTGNYGMICHARYTPGAQTSYINADWSNRSQPIWLAIVRTGNKFDFYKSDDAQNWSPLGSAQVIMGSEIYVGMALTSHSSSKTAIGNYEYFGVDEYDNSRNLGVADINVENHLGPKIPLE